METGCCESSGESNALAACLSPFFAGIFPVIHGADLTGIATRFAAGILPKMMMLFTCFSGLFSKLKF